MEYFYYNRKDYIIVCAATQTVTSWPRTTLTDPIVGSVRLKFS